MQNYNQREYVKSRKAAYMRKKRVSAAKVRAREVVRAFLDVGFEDQAFEYAKEFAPEMLLTVKARRPLKQRK